MTNQNEAWRKFCMSERIFGTRGGNPFHFVTLRSRAFTSLHSVPGHSLRYTPFQGIHFVTLRSRARALTHADALERKERTR